MGKELHALLAREIAEAGEIGRLSGDYIGPVHLSAEHLEALIGNFFYRFKKCPICEDAAAMMADIDAEDAARTYARAWICAEAATFISEFSIRAMTWLVLRLGKEKAVEKVKPFLRDKRISNPFQYAQKTVERELLDAAASRDTVDEAVRLIKEGAT